jgi:hypothetical protein
VNIGYLTSFTETDPIAIAKTETISNGWGMKGGGSAQTIGSNPAWTLYPDSVYVASKARLYKVRDSIVNIGYLTANQTVTLAGAVTGSGATSITTTLAASVVGTANLSATGTPSATTFLRGDNTWAAASTSGVTSVVGTTNQITITGTTTPTISIAATYTGQSSINTVGSVGTGTWAATIQQPAVAYSVLPAAPAAGNLIMGATNMNGIEEGFFQPSSGIGYPVQSDLAGLDIGHWTTNGTGPQQTGRYVSAITLVGAGSFNLRTYDATNVAPNQIYEKLIGSASANNQVEAYFGFTSRDAMIGNAKYGAGSKLGMHFCIPGYVSTQRFFAGYASTFAQLSTTTDPSGLTNIIGIGKDAADATFYIMANDGSGTATKINTGITPTANDEYFVTVTLPSNTTTETVWIERRTKTASTTFSYTFSTDIPNAGTLMYVHLSSNSAAVSTAPTLGLMEIIEQFKPF